MNAKKTVVSIQMLFSVALGPTASSAAWAGGIYCKSCIQEPRCRPRPECTKSVVAKHVFDQRYCALEGQNQKLEWSFKPPGTAYFSDSLAGAPNPFVDLFMAIKLDDNHFDVLEVEKGSQNYLKTAASFYYVESLDLIVGGPEGEPSRAYESSSCY